MNEEKMSIDRLAPSVNETLQTNYDGFYVDGKNKWRELGARHKVDNIVSLCSSVPHASIVDIGAGEGAISAELSRRNFSSDITCLEISESGVEVIKERNLSNVKEVRRFDGYHIPFEDEHFDLAIASHVLEHVEHQRQFIYEAKRVAKYLFIEVPLEDTLRLPLDFKLDAVGHINFYNYKTVRRLLQSSGLEVLDQKLRDTPLDIHTFNGKAKGTAKFIVRRVVGTLGSRFSSRYFTHRCAMLCRKLDD